MLRCGDRAHVVTFTAHRLVHIVPMCNELHGVDLAQHSVGILRPLSTLRRIACTTNEEVEPGVERAESDTHGKGRPGREHLPMRCGACRMGRICYIIEMVVGLCNDERVERVASPRAGARVREARSPGPQTDQQRVLRAQGAERQQRQSVAARTTLL